MIGSERDPKIFLEEIVRMEKTAEECVVVMTGGTGGFGAHALRHLASQTNMRVIVGIRDLTREVPEGVEVLPLDLASLESVRQFADMLKWTLHGAEINVLVLNAGVHLSNTERKTVDGYEWTFAVNHLAHFLLTQLLTPQLSRKGRLVFTTSDTHDPAITRMAPKALDPKALAFPTERGLNTGMHAYTSSKLCNMMTALSFAELDDIKSRQINVVAFNPGLTSGAAGRDSPVAARIMVRLLMHTVFRLVGLFRPEFIMNTPEHSGKKLAEVSLGIVSPPAGRIYVSLVRGMPEIPNPSELALNRTARDQLWCETCKMVERKNMHEPHGPSD